jgi:hypothetical protein
MAAEKRLFCQKAASRFALPPHSRTQARNKDHGLAVERIPEDRFLSWRLFLACLFVGFHHNNQNHYQHEAIYENPPLASCCLFPGIFRLTVLGHYVLREHQ